MCAAYEGRFDEARALAASSREILERLGQANMLAQSVAMMQGLIERLAGNLAEAEAKLRYSVERTATSAASRSSPSTQRYWLTSCSPKASSTRPRS